MQSLAAVAVHISCRNGGRGFALSIIAIVQVKTVHVLGPISRMITYRDDDRVCSKHFVEGQPTVSHPCPALHMGYNYQPKKHQVRAARKTRTIQNFTQYSLPEEKN